MNEESSCLTVQHELVSDEDIKAMRHHKLFISHSDT